MGKNQFRLLNWIGNYNGDNYTESSLDSESLFWIWIKHISNNYKQDILKNLLVILLLNLNNYSTTFIQNKNKKSLKFEDFTMVFINFIKG